MPDPARVQRGEQRPEPFGMLVEDCEIRQFGVPLGGWRFALGGPPFVAQALGGLVLALPSALHAIASMCFALARKRAAMHNDCAFQASSPKNFSGRARPGLFSCPRFRHKGAAVAGTEQEKTKRRSGAAGETGTGRRWRGGSSAVRALPRYPLPGPLPAPRLKSVRNRAVGVFRGAGLETRSFASFRTASQLTVQAVFICAGAA